MANCNDYISADDLKTGRQAILHIKHVAKSEDVSGNHALEVTDEIRGELVTNYTLDGLEDLYIQAIKNLGWNPVGTFQAGATLTQLNDIIQDTSTSTWYRWDGLLPKNVPVSSTPSGTGGVAQGAWQIVDVSDVLRRDLASSDPSKGDELIGVKSVLAGAIARTQHGKNSDTVSIYDFGATWDGTLHPLSEIFSTLTAAQVVYPFVTSLSQSRDYAALQAACDSKKTVLIPKGTGFVNATIVFNNSVRIIGENTDSINRAQSFISVDGNISLFALAQGSSSGGTKMIQLFIDGLYIFYNPGTTPTVITGNSGKIAFNFYSTEAGTTGLEMSEIKNCTVHGAWRCFSDTTGTYLTKLQNVWARNCHDGFIKAFGTTILMESCYTLGCISPYQFGAVMSVTMLNCAMDQSAISVSGGSYGNAGLHFINSHSVNIIGLSLIHI